MFAVAAVGLTGRAEAQFGKCNTDQMEFSVGAFAERATFDPLPMANAVGGLARLRPNRSCQLSLTGTTAAYRPEYPGSFPGLRSFRAQEWRLFIEYQRLFLLDELTAVFGGGAKYYDFAWSGRNGPANKLRAGGEFGFEYKLPKTPQVVFRVVGTAGGSPFGGRQAGASRSLMLGAQFRFGCIEPPPSQPGINCR